MTASEVVRRIATYKPPPQLAGTWTAFVEGMRFPQELAHGLLDPDGFDEFLETLPVGFSRLAHACTHTTFSPNVAHGGTKTNVIPDTVELEVDIRTLPGQEGDAARSMILEAIGDLADRVDIWSNDDPSTKSEIDTPLWDAMTRVTGRLCEGSALVPFMMVGGTDNRYFRRAGSVGYGFGLFSEKLKFEDYASMFHGNDERVDQDSLLLSTELWLALAREFLTRGRIRCAGSIAHPIDPADLPPAPLLLLLASLFAEVALELLGEVVARGEISLARVAGLGVEAALELRDVGRCVGVTDDCRARPGCASLRRRGRAR